MNRKAWLPATMTPVSSIANTFTLPAETKQLVEAPITTNFLIPVPHCLVCSLHERPYSSRTCPKGQSLEDQIYCLFATAVALGALIAGPVFGTVLRIPKGGVKNEHG